MISAVVWRYISMPTVAYQGYLIIMIIIKNVIICRHLWVDLPRPCDFSHCLAWRLNTDSISPGFETPSHIRCGPINFKYATCFFLLANVYATCAKCQRHRKKCCSSQRWTNSGNQESIDVLRKYYVCVLSKIKAKLDKELQE